MIQGCWDSCDDPALFQSRLGRLASAGFGLVVNNGLSAVNVGAWYAACRMVGAQTWVPAACAPVFTRGTGPGGYLVGDDSPHVAVSTSCGFVTEYHPFALRVSSRFCADASEVATEFGLDPAANCYAADVYPVGNPSFHPSEVIAALAAFRRSRILGAGKTVAVNAQAFGWTQDAQDGDRPGLRGPFPTVEQMRAIRTAAERLGIPNLLWFSAYFFMPEQPNPHGWPDRLAEVQEAAFGTTTRGGSMEGSDQRQTVTLSYEAFLAAYAAALKACAAAEDAFVADPTPQNLAPYHRAMYRVQALRQAIRDSDTLADAVGGDPAPPASEEPEEG